MRVVAYALLAAGALTIGAAGPASAGCYRDCDYGYRSAPAYGYDYAPRFVAVYVRRPNCVASYEAVPYERPCTRYYKPYRSYGCRSYDREDFGYGYQRCYPPPIIYGDAQSQRGPVYSSTGHYYYGPYVSHRAEFGYGGCRTAVLPYGPTWHVASNC